MDDATLWTSIAGFLLSALFKYFPALRERFDKLDGDMKRAWMLLLVAGVSLVMSFNQYYNGATCPANATIEQCSMDLLLGFFKGWAARFFAAMVVNQAAFLVLPGRVAAPVEVTDAK